MKNEALIRRIAIFMHALVAEQLLGRYERGSQRVEELVTGEVQVALRATLLDLRAEVKKLIPVRQIEIDETRVWDTAIRRVLALIAAHLGEASAEFDTVARERDEEQLRVEALTRTLAGKLKAAEARVVTERDALKEVPTLQSLSAALGWGCRTASEAYNFAYEREQLLRLAQSELETHKSNAPTSREALLDRIRTLRTESEAISAASDDLPRCDAPPGPEGP